MCTNCHRLYRTTSAYKKLNIGLPGGKSRDRYTCKYIRPSAVCPLPNPRENDVKSRFEISVEYSSQGIACHRFLEATSWNCVSLILKFSGRLYCSARVKRELEFLLRENGMRKGIPSLFSVSSYSNLFGLGGIRNSLHGQGHGFDDRFRLPCVR